MSATFTIAIPVFERTFRFEESLLSAMGVEECSEILVIDDGSSHDRFKEICLHQKDGRIRYKRNDNNLGIFGNWNRCAQEATGDYISILCSDDIIEPDIYKRFSSALQREPMLDVYFGSFVIFEENIEDAKTLKTFPAGPISAQWLLEDAVEKGPGFPVLSVIRKQTLLRFPFVANPHSGNDWLWIYSNATRFTLYADAKPLSYWRRHPEQDASTSFAITTDCWPLMYTEIESQLRTLNSKKVKTAKRRATGVVLTWLLNDRIKHGRWHRRLMGAEGFSNPFLKTARNIATHNWLLSRMLAAEGTWLIYYHIGRVSRKLKLYYPTFYQK